MERLPRLQENIEGEEVGIVAVEVLSGWIVRVRHQTLRIDVVDESTELRKQLTDRLRSDPSDHVSWNFVADRDAEDHRVAGNTLRKIERRIARFSAHRLDVREAAAEQIAPVAIIDAGQNPQAKLASNFNHVRRWCGVCAHDREAGLGDFF